MENAMESVPEHIEHDRVIELIRRDADPEEYGAIRQLWKTHSMAEDARDIPGLMSTLTGDCVYEVYPDGFRWEGHEGATRFYVGLLTAFPDIHFDLTDIVIGPQGVCEWARVSGTHEARWLHHEPSHQRLVWNVVILFPWDRERRLFKGEKVYSDAMSRPVATRNPRPSSSSVWRGSPAISPQIVSSHSALLAASATE